MQMIEAATIQVGRLGGDLGAGVREEFFGIR
jgi:hypothetical protein